MSIGGYYRLEVKGHGTAGVLGAVADRSGGIIAKIAYRSAERIQDYDGNVVYDFTKRAHSVKDTLIITPEDAPEWSHHRAMLWNKAIMAEHRENGRLATEFIISLPHELTAEQRREAAIQFIKEQIVDRYHVAADISFHTANDERNVHCHVMLTHRELGPHGFGDIANRRIIERIRHGKLVHEQVAGIAATPADVRLWREAWAQHANRAYAAAGLEISVDHRSYKARGIDREPTRHLGHAAAALERRGVLTEVGNINRAIEARNAQRQRQRETVVEQVDDLSPKLLQAITEALRYTDAQDQSARLIWEVDNVIKHTTTAPAPSSQLAKDLMRAIKVALLEAAPEHTLIEETGEAIHREQERRQLHTQHRDALEATAQLDRVPSGWRPLDITDVARQMSPSYAKAVAAQEQTRKLAARLKKTRQHWERQREVAEYRVDERRAEMGALRKLLDWTARPSRHDRRPEMPARGRDLELWKWENEAGKARYLATRAGIRQKAAEDLLEMRTRRTKAEYEVVLPAAQARLAALQRQAQPAQQELAQMREHERQQAQHVRLVRGLSP